MSLNDRANARRYRHKNNHYKNQKKYNARIRQEVLAAYGGKCTCCGEADWHFLAIDHVFGVLPGLPAAREGLYGWLRRNGYPQFFFQILCYNCNSAKGYYGSCPHQGTPSYNRSAAKQARGQYNAIYTGLRLVPNEQSQGKLDLTG